MLLVSFAQESFPNLIIDHKACFQSDSLLLMHRWEAGPDYPLEQRGMCPGAQGLWYNENNRAETIPLVT